MSKIEDASEVHVLVSDEALLAHLNREQVGIRRGPHTRLGKVGFTHPKDFRGYEASTVVSVNVSDEWILEAISRSTTRLIIIDSIPNHLALWQTMEEEGRIEVEYHIIDNRIEKKPLLQHDDDLKFLLVSLFFAAFLILSHFRLLSFNSLCS